MRFLSVDRVAASADVLAMSDTGSANDGFVQRTDNADVIGAFLLAPVPRREIPEVIRRAASPGWEWWGLVLFGGIFAFVGTLLTALFFPYDFRNDSKLDKNHGETVGRVTSVRRTNMSINDVSVYCYEFEFTAGDFSGGRQGECYTTGSKWSEGAQVSVWYAPGDASVAKIEGSRMNESSFVAIFVLIFPLVGFGVLFFAIRWRRSFGWLLVNGLPGEFRVERIEETGVSINKQMRYRAECRREDDVADEACYCYASHVRGKVALMEELRSSGRTVFALYDPRERGKKRRRVELCEAWFR